MTSSSTEEFSDLEREDTRDPYEEERKRLQTQEQRDRLNRAKCPELGKKKASDCRMNLKVTTLNPAMSLVDGGAVEEHEDNNEKMYDPCQMLSIPPRLSRCRAAFMPALISEGDLKAGHTRTAAALASKHAHTEAMLRRLYQRQAENPLICPTFTADSPLVTRAAKPKRAQNNWLVATNKFMPGPDLSSGASIKLFEATGREKCLAFTDGSAQLKLRHPKAKRRNERAFYCLQDPAQHPVSELANFESPLEDAIIDFEIYGDQKLFVLKHATSVSLVTPGGELGQNWTEPNHEIASICCGEPFDSIYMLSTGGYLSTINIENEPTLAYRERLFSDELSDFRWGKLIRSPCDPPLLHVATRKSVKLFDIRSGQVTDELMSLGKDVPEIVTSISTARTNAEFHAHVLTSDSAYLLDRRMPGECLCSLPHLSPNVPIGMTNWVDTRNNGTEYLFTYSEKGDVTVMAYGRHAVRDQVLVYGLPAALPSVTQVLSEVHLGTSFAYDWMSRPWSGICATDSMAGEGHGNSNGATIFSVTRWGQVFSCELKPNSDGDEHEDDPLIAHLSAGSKEWSIAKYVDDDCRDHVEQFEEKIAVVKPRKLATTTEVFVRDAEPMENGVEGAIKHQFPKPAKKEMFNSMAVRYKETVEARERRLALKEQEEDGLLPPRKLNKLKKQLVLVEKRLQGDEDDIRQVYLDCQEEQKEKNRKKRRKEVDFKTVPALNKLPLKKIGDDQASRVMRMFEGDFDVFDDRPPKSESEAPLGTDPISDAASTYSGAGKSTKSNISSPPRPSSAISGQVSPSNTNGEPPAGPSAGVLDQEDSKEQQPPGDFMVNEWIQSNQVSVGPGDVRNLKLQEPASMMEFNPNIVSTQQATTQSRGNKTNDPSLIKSKKKRKPKHGF